MQLEIPDSVYCPDEDSLMLAKEIEKLGERLEDSRLLEIGCGSGFLSILASKLGANVIAIDINPEAVEITKKNSSANNADVIAMEADLFSNVNGEFDYIIFNSPYLPDSDIGIPGREQWSLKQSGINIIEKFITQSKKHLAVDGKILLLYSSLSGDVPGLFEKNGFESRIVSKKKLDFEELFISEAKLK